MASILKRNNSYSVIYYYTDDTGTRRQKWESYKTEEQAHRKKLEIENPFLLPELPKSIITVNYLMEQFFTLYGTMHWTYSTAENYESLKRRFISPLIGTMHIEKVTGLLVTALYQRLVKGRKPYLPICNSILRDLHKLLKCAFRQAVVWGVLDHSPLDNIAIPKELRKRMPAWNAPQVKKLCLPVGMTSCFRLQFSLRLRVRCAWASCWH